MLSSIHDLLLFSLSSQENDVDMQRNFSNHQASSSAGHQEKSTEGKTPHQYHTPGPVGLGPGKRAMCLFSKSQQPGFHTWGRAANERGKSVEPEPESKSYRPGKPSCLLASSLLSVPVHLLRDDLLGNEHSSQFWGQDFFSPALFWPRVLRVHSRKASGSVRKTTAGVRVQRELCKRLLMFAPGLLF